jgi:RNA polymerase sigma-70 factor, ECF subfamily
MGGAQLPDITELLRKWASGNPSAANELGSLVYDELRRIARKHIRSRNCPTLQTTALTHEVFLRLVGSNGIRWKDRAHFFAVAAQMTRRILVDAARARVTAKRNGNALHVTFDEALASSIGRSADVVALDDALDTLARMDPRKAKVVELRFFGGLNVEEVAAVLKLSVGSVERDWRMAKPWLAREIQRGGGKDDS